MLSPQAITICARRRTAAAGDGLGLKGDVAGERGDGRDAAVGGAAEPDGGRVGRSVPAVRGAGRVVTLPSDTSGRWWTWAGTAANRTLQASLPGMFDTRQRIGEKSVRLLPGVGPDDPADALAEARSGRGWSTPHASRAAISGLKFSAALPEGLARFAGGAPPSAGGLPIGTATSGSIRVRVARLSRCMAATSGVR